MLDILLIAYHKYWISSNFETKKSLLKLIQTLKYFCGLTKQVFLKKVVKVLVAVMKQNG